MHACTRAPCATVAYSETQHTHLLPKISPQARATRQQAAHCNDCAGSPSMHHLFPLPAPLSPDLLPHPQSAVPPWHHPPSPPRRPPSQPLHSNLHSPVHRAFHLAHPSSCLFHHCYAPQPSTLHPRESLRSSLFPASHPSRPSHSLLSSLLLTRLPANYVRNPLRLCLSPRAPRLALPVPCLCPADSSPLQYSSVPSNLLSLGTLLQRDRLHFRSDCLCQQLLLRPPLQCRALALANQSVLARNQPPGLAASRS